MKNRSSTAPYKRIFVVKVVIEKRLIHTGGGGDGVHAGTRQTFLGKLGQGGLEDGVAAGFRLTAGAAARSEECVPRSDIFN